MTRRLRLSLFAVSAVVLGALLLWALAGLRSFGDFQGQYGRVLNGVTQQERHVSNVVAAVVFDYRGLDTLGEEFILFAAVMGVALLLREVREEAERRIDRERSEVIRAVGLALVGPVVILGLSIVAHGYLTPGGGFQGGVAVSAGLLLVYAAGRYRAFRRVSPQALLDFAEGIGAGAFAVAGLAGLVAGGAYLENVLRLGTTGTLSSGGTIPLLNAAVGLEVAAALALLFHEFLEELMVPWRASAEDPRSRR
jgi:multicomponent Na+:H+ antiporter subunit B